VGFEQREKKRRARAARAAAQSRARASGSSSSRWWLTIVTSTTCCARCTGVLRPGREMVYRHRPLEARCLSCAEGLSFRPSTRWEAKHKPPARRAKR
jgi:hypothetical protein